jgi:hypothetical protein
MVVSGASTTSRSAEFRRCSRCRSPFSRHRWERASDQPRSRRSRRSRRQLAGSQLSPEMAALARPRDPQLDHPRSSVLPPSTAAVPVVHPILAVLPGRSPATRVEHNRPACTSCSTCSATGQRILQWCILAIVICSGCSGVKSVCRVCHYSCDADIQPVALVWPHKPGGGQSHAETG